MDECLHPVFFEAEELTDSEKEKIRRYFQKKRHSGGGDCGMIEKVGDKTYRICFKEKEDQEHVLRRNTHTINFNGRDLNITLSESSPSHGSANLPQTAKGLQKTFSLDIFLLYYLRDNLKAFKILKKQLSSVGCTVEFNFEEEKAVVREDMRKGPGGCSAEKVEQQLAWVFTSLIDTYLCYHVVKPKQVKMVLQDSAFKTDDIKVYTESGYAVVVGEVDVVKEKIAILKKSLPTKKELPLVEKLFKLVEEEFNREMFANYPDVKVVRGSATITLEGPDKEVQSGAAKLDELIKNIKEKRVKFPTALLTFIKTSGAISKYQARFQQSLRNPVFFEVGSDLVLSSLSSDALNEAEAAVMRDLKSDIIELQGAAAVPPDLDRVKEILMKAKKEANISELRVDVSFIPGARGTAMTKVRLVGYSEDVNKLNEVLHGFQKNEVDIQEVVNLSHPELVDCFDKVLGLIGMKQSNVTLEASHVPHPCVLVKGPRSLVQKVRTDLATSLAQLSTDTVVLNELAVQWYFQGDGRQNTELVERSCQVLIREKQHLQTPTSDLADITITLKGRVKLQVMFGDITNETTDAVVNTTDFKDFQTDGVCKDILRKAGPQVEAALKNRKVNSGEILETPPGMFPCKAILHVCGEKDTVAIEQLLRRIIQLCESSDYKSLAVPAICAGSGGLDPDSVAHAILQGVKTAASSHPLQRLTNIRLVLNKLTVFLAFKKKAMQMFPFAVINSVSAYALQCFNIQVMNDPRISHISSTAQQSAFLIVGLCRKNVDDAIAMLGRVYQPLQSTQTKQEEKSYSWDCFLM
ncbi:uncharacterized protein LOC143416476 [Maylandia zebra]|uniref:uncharacterized protein LOC143416476 n=1 Tax=Maylandia zebra TaxID=106582 RepID=UPI00403C539E